MPKAPRPTIRIPPRETRQITNGDKIDLNGNYQIIRASFDDKATTSSEDDEEDEEVVPEDEPDLDKEHEGLKDDLSYENGVQAAEEGCEHLRQRTRSEKAPQGLGLLRLLGEDSRLNFRVYSNPLLDEYSRDEPPLRNSAPKIPKRRQAHRHRLSTPRMKDDMQDLSPISELTGKHELISSSKSVRFESADQAILRTRRESEESEDDDDSDFKPEEARESDKENADPQAYGTDLHRDDNNVSNTSSTSFSELRPSDSDETSSLGSSSSSDANSDSDSSSGSEPNVVCSSVHVQKGGYSRTSSSNSSNRSSGSESKAKSSVPDTSRSSNSVSDRRQTVPPKIPQSMNPPGTGKKHTRKRNERRRNNLALRKLISRGVLPVGSTHADLYRIRETREITKFQNDKTEPKIPKQQIADAESSEVNLKDPLAAPPSGWRRWTPALQEDEICIHGSDDHSSIIKQRHASEPQVPLHLEQTIPPSSSVQLQDPNGEQVPAEINQPAINPVARLMVQPAVSQNGDAIAKKDFIETPGSANASNNNARAIPDSQPRRSKLDLASSKRLLFGSLGLKAPKTEEDASSLRAQLMKGVRPLRQSAASVEGKNQAVAVSDESWKDIIDLRAVECCHDGIVLSTPPFPFVQRWDPQQQRDYRTPNSKQQFRKRKRKRNDSGIYSSHCGESFNDPIRNKSPRREGYKPPGDCPEFEAQGSSPVSTLQQDISPYTNSSQDAQAANDQLIRETIGSADKTQAIDEDEDLPALPDDLSTCTALTEENCKPGALIAFKKIEMSVSNGWQPCISGHRTAKVDFLLGNGMLQMTWTKRDQPDHQRRYDDETGERLYGKFEMPGYDDENEDEDPSKVSIMYKELIDPKLIRAAKQSVSTDDHREAESVHVPVEVDVTKVGGFEEWTKDPASDLAALSSLEEPTGNQTSQIYTPYQTPTFEKKRKRHGNPQQSLDNPRDSTPDTFDVEEPSTQIRQEISELFRDSGWRSSLEADVHQQNDGLGETVALEQDHSDHKIHAVSNLPSPIFNGFSSPQPVDRSGTTSPLNESIQKRQPAHHEIAESVPRSECEKLNTSIPEENGTLNVEYPSLPPIEEKGDVFENHRQHRSISFEADRSQTLPDAISPPSLRRQVQQTSPSLATDSQAEDENTTMQMLTGKGSDSDEFPKLFSQAFESRLSQETDIKPELSQGKGLLSSPRRRSKLKPRRRSNSDTTSPRLSRSPSTRERPPEWTFDEVESIRTLRSLDSCQIKQSSQIVDFTMSSDSLNPDHIYNDGDGNYRASSKVPAGSGCINKRKGKRGSTAEAVRGRKTANG